MHASFRLAAAMQGRPQANGAGNGGDKVSAASATAGIAAAAACPIGGCIPSQRKGKREILVNGHVMHI